MGQSQRDMDSTAEEEDFLLGMLRFYCEENMNCWTTIKVWLVHDFNKLVSKLKWATKNVHMPMHFRTLTRKEERKSYGG